MADSRVTAELKTEGHIATMYTLARIQDAATAWLALEQATGYLQRDVRPLPWRVKLRLRWGVLRERVGFWIAGYRPEDEW